MEIYYCNKCGIRVSSTDIELGRGALDGEAPYCHRCARKEGLYKKEGPQLRRKPGARPRPRPRPKNAEKVYTSDPAHGSGRIASAGSAKIPIVRKSSKSTAIILGIAGSIIALLIIIVSMSGGKPDPSPGSARSTDPEAPETQAVIPEAPDEYVPSATHRTTARVETRYSGLGWLPLVSSDWRTYLTAVGTWGYRDGRLYGHAAPGKPLMLETQADWDDIELGISFEVKQGDDLTVSFRIRGDKSGRIILAKVGHGANRHLLLKIEGDQITQAEIDGRTIRASTEHIKSDYAGMDPEKGRISLYLGAPGTGAAAIIVNEIGIRRLKKDPPPEVVVTPAPAPAPETQDKTLAPAPVVPVVTEENMVLQTIINETFETDTISPEWKKVGDMPTKVVDGQMEVDTKNSGGTWRAGGYYLNQEFKFDKPLFIQAHITVPDSSANQFAGLTIVPELKFNHEGQGNRFIRLDFRANIASFGRNLKTVEKWKGVVQVRQPMLWQLKVDKDTIRMSVDGKVLYDGPHGQPGMETGYVMFRAGNKSDDRGGITRFDNIMVQRLVPIAPEEPLPIGPQSADLSDKEQWNQHGQGRISHQGGQTVIRTNGIDFMFRRKVQNFILKGRAALPDTKGGFNSLIVAFPTAGLSRGDTPYMVQFTDDGTLFFFEDGKRTVRENRKWDGSKAFTWEIKHQAGHIKALVNGKVLLDRPIDPVPAGQLIVGSKIDRSSCRVTVADLLIELLPDSKITAPVPGAVPAKAAIIQFKAADQVSPGRDLDRGTELIRRAARNGAGLVMLPATAFMPAFSSEVVKHAETVEGPTVKVLQKLAEKLGVFIAVGIREKISDSRTANTAVLIDNKGEVILLQRKLALASKETSYTNAGTEIPAVITPWGKTVFLISKDVHSGNALSRIEKEKPDLILVPNRDESRTQQRYVDKLAPAAKRQQATVLIANHCIDGGGGYSCVILPDGSFTNINPPVREGILYAALPLKPRTGNSGLIGEWRLGQTSGNSIIDNSGLGNPGILHKGPVWAEAQGRRGLAFDGRDDYAVLREAFTPPAQVTLTCWVRPEQFGDFRRMVSGHDAFEAVIEEDGRVSHQLFTAGRVYLKSRTILKLKSWAHVALTADRATKEQIIYINGKLDARRTAGSMENVGPIPLTLGFRPESRTYFAGIISDVMLFNRVLSESEINVLASQ